MEFAATHSDIVFAPSPTGASPEKACVALSEKITTIKERARANSRTVKVLVNPHVICRPTDGEAVAWHDRIFKDRDRVAARNFYKAFAGGDQSSWRGHTERDWAIGGNLHLVGSPHSIVDWFLRLHEAGVDGVQLNFFDFEPDLKYFTEAVLPLMQQSGLRQPVAALPREV